MSNCNRVATFVSISEVVCKSPQAKPYNSREELLSPINEDQAVVVSLMVSNNGVDFVGTSASYTFSEVFIFVSQ